MAEDYCWRCGRWRWLRPGAICMDCLEKWFASHVHRVLP